MTFELVENTLKKILLNNIKVVSKKRTLGTGQVILYDIKDFNIKLFFANGKKLELLYPFNVISEKKIIYFDYTLQHIHQDDILWRPRVNRLIKNKRNKYCDLLLSIEIL
jgi:ubiquinone biosynthesis protein UbiJ